MGQNHTDRPSRRQLAYLRALADRAGQTFAYPQTRRQASLEIQRLERTVPDTPIAFAIYTKCAARRLVVSPVQPGGTRREVLGSNGLPGSER